MFKLSDLPYNELLFEPGLFFKTKLYLKDWNYESVSSALWDIYDPDNRIDNRLITNPITDHNLEPNREGTWYTYKLWELYPDPWTLIRDRITNTVNLLLGKDLECVEMTTSLMEPEDFTITHTHDDVIHAIWYLSDEELDDLILYSNTGFGDPKVHSRVPVESNDLLIFSGNTHHGTEDLSHKRCLIALSFTEKVKENQ